MYLQRLVQQTSNCHIEVVVNSLKFIVLDYLLRLRKNLGFWTDAEISATGP